MSAPLLYKGILKGHSKWITNINVPFELDSQNGKYEIASSSRDGSAIVWQVDPEASDVNNGSAGVALKSFKKHCGEINHCFLSKEGRFLLTAAADKTMNLWDIESGVCFRRFKGHTAEVTCAVISNCSRYIVSASRDKTLRLWNTLGEEKFCFSRGGHTDVVTCVCFSPDQSANIIVSGSVDGTIRLWNLDTCSLLYSFSGHTGPINSIAMSPDGSLVASGGSDGKIHLWDVSDYSHVYTLDVSSPVYSLCFTPCNYWISAATNTGIKIIHLERKVIISDIRMVSDRKPDSNENEIQEFRRKKNVEPTVIATIESKQKPAKHLPWCTSLAWSRDGYYLFAGSNTGDIYILGLRDRC